MTTRTITRVLFSLITITLVASSWAFTRTAAIQNDSCGCNAVLVPSVTKLATNKQLQYAYLRIIDQNSFEEIKRGVGTSMSVLIEGIPIGGNANWDDFRQKRESLFEKNRVSLSYNEAIVLVTSGLEPHETAAWSSCKERCSRAGFTCWTADNQETVVTVTCEWNPPPGGSPGTISSSSLSGGTSPDAPAGKAFPVDMTFQSNSRQSFIYNRRSGETLTLIANVSGYTTTLSVPPPPRPTPPPKPPRDEKVVAIDTILCSGADCRLPHISQGNWQVVEWMPASAATYALGPQMSLPDKVSQDIFCKNSNQVTKSELENAVRDVSYVVTDNSEAEPFFDLRGTPKTRFEWSSGGRFYFFNNCQVDCNKHLRLTIRITMKPSDCTSQ